MRLAGFVNANCDLLHQLEQVLDKVSTEQYGRSQETIFDASIGGHVRHILDHYDNFLGAVLLAYPDRLESFELCPGRPMINYDQRPRERNIEIDIDIARQRVQRICAALEQMPRNDVEVDTILQIDSAPEAVLQRSTTGRELSFLHSHTVHHLAILSYMLKSLGLEGLPDNFGIAPSTIKFREAM